MKTIYRIISLSLLIGITACLFGFAIGMIVTKNNQPLQIFMGDSKKSTPDFISITEKSVSSDRVKILETQKSLMNEIMDYRIAHGDNTVGWSVNVNFFDAK
jgi:ABC-type lipoprotein release transport system permease subunit